MTPTIVIISIAAYFLLFFGVSYLAGHKSGTSGFFAERRMPWIVVALATIGAPISGVTFISVPGMVVDKGHSYLQMAMGFVIGYMVIAYMLVPLFYKRNLISIYGYLGQRFGFRSYFTGGCFFFLSKMLGAAVRFFVVCVVLQSLVFQPLGIPFAVNVTVTVGLLCLSTYRGGVKSIIWTDVVKSVCLVTSVLLCIFFIARSLDYSFSDMVSAIGGHESSRIFYFDNPAEKTYFWKQFVAGIFMVIAMTGLDQDMMQRNLACRDFRQCRKNMLTSSLLQLVVIGLFLVLGTILYIFIQHTPSLSMPESTDEIFSLVTTHDSIPIITGVLFVVGLVSVSYSAAASALVSLTTSFTVDILQIPAADEARIGRCRTGIHFSMGVVMALIIILFYQISNDDAISIVYEVASYTYGPILGLFIFGMSTPRPVNDRLVPLVCILSPVLSWCIQHWLLMATGYAIGFELLLLNALLTIGGLWILSLRPMLTLFSTRRVTTQPAE